MLFFSALDSLQSCSSRFPDQSSPVTFCPLCPLSPGRLWGQRPSFYRTSPAIRSSSWRIRSPLWCSRLPHCDLLLIAHWDKTFLPRRGQQMSGFHFSSPGFSEVFSVQSVTQLRQSVRFRSACCSPHGTCREV